MKRWRDDCSYVMRVSSCLLCWISFLSTRTWFFFLISYSIFHFFFFFTFHPSAEYLDGARKVVARRGFRLLANGDSLQKSPNEYGNSRVHEGVAEALDVAELWARETRGRLFPLVDCECQTHKRDRVTGRARGAEGEGPTWTSNGWARRGRDKGRGVPALRDRGNWTSR